MYGQRSFDCAADSLREPAGSAQDDNVRTKVHRFRKHKVLRLRLPIHFVNPRAALRMTMYGHKVHRFRKHKVLRLRLPIHFVNPQGSAARRIVHRFRNTRSFDCAADSLREPAGSAQDDNVRTKVHRFGNTRSFDCAADSLRESSGLRSG